MIPDFLDLLRALLAADARFMIVGAYAVGVHGGPRATKDLDVWVEASSSNAPKVMAALRDFGAPLMGLSESDLERPGIGLQIGVEPGRIDDPQTPALLGVARRCQAVDSRVTAISFGFRPLVPYIS